MTCEPCWFHSVICGEMVWSWRDARDHLPRTVDRLLLGELEHAQAAVVLAIAAGHEPRGQVLAPGRREREHLDELGVALARQPHDRVVRLHHTAALGAFLEGGNLPLVLAVVEHARLRHVIGGVHRGLSLKKMSSG